jgi:hypothetical protein
MLQVGCIFILQLLIPFYLIILRLVICFEALAGLILVFWLTFFRLHLIGIPNKPKFSGSTSVRFDTTFKWLVRFRSLMGSTQRCTFWGRMGPYRFPCFSNLPPTHCKDVDYSDFDSPLLPFLLKIIYLNLKRSDDKMNY